MTQPTTVEPLSAMAAVFDGDVTAQFSVVPASDRFIPIILHAIDGFAGTKGLTVSTDSVSSQLSGRPDIVFGALTEALVRAAGSGAHVVQFILASRGRSRENGSTRLVSLPPDRDFIEEAVRAFAQPTASGVPVAAQFSFLPLADAGYSETIRQIIVFLDAVGLRTTLKELVVRIDGDAALVGRALSTILTHFGDPSAHVVLSATLVANLPVHEASR